MQRCHKRILIRNFSKAYVNVQENSVASNAVKTVVDSYKNNLLKNIGLPFEKDETMLNFDERRILLKLSSKIMAASNMLENGYKSMNSWKS